MDGQRKDLELYEYWHVKEEITVCDEFVLRCERLIVPERCGREFTTTIWALRSAKVENVMSYFGLV